MKNFIISAFLLASVAVVTGCSTTSNIKETVANSVYAETANFIYEDFSAEKFEDVKGKERFAVFVHSKTCGTCAKKNKQIIEEANDFGSGQILKMEYSEAPQWFLKEYAVTKYDSFVLFESDGSANTIKGASVDEVRKSFSS